MSKPVCYYHSIWRYCQNGWKAISYWFNPSKYTIGINVFKLISQIGILRYFSEIVFKWEPQDITDVSISLGNGVVRSHLYCVSFMMFYLSCTHYTTGHIQCEQCIRFILACLKRRIASFGQYILQTNREQFSAICSCPLPIIINVNISYISFHSHEHKCVPHPTLDKMAAILADVNFEGIFLNENNRMVHKLALVQVMTWCQTGETLLPEPMLTEFTDAYMRH